MTKPKEIRVMVMDEHTVVVTFPNGLTHVLGDEGATARTIFKVGDVETDNHYPQATLTLGGLQ